MVKLGVTLLLICGIAGLGLAAVYAKTDPIIQQRAKEDLLAAAKSAMPGADTILEQVKDGTAYWLGQSAGKTIGAAMKVVSGGYSPTPIEMTVGVDASGKVTKVIITAISETPGVGLKVRDEAFLAKFAGAPDPQKVDGISGATFSSRAVKNGVAAAMEFLGSIIAPKLAKPTVDIGRIADGTYSGTAGGLMGPIEVSVKVAGGKIIEVTVLSNKETPGVADSALRQIPKSIVEKQKIDVDTVSGATFASKGIIEAVRNALAIAQAK
jgi:fumarate reductase flavoprotein subunit/urocanate reductase